MGNSVQAVTRAQDWTKHHKECLNTKLTMFISRLSTLPTLSNTYLSPVYKSPQISLKVYHLACHKVIWTVEHFDPSYSLISVPLYLQLAVRSCWLEVSGDVRAQWSYCTLNQQHAHMWKLKLPEDGRSALTSRLHTSHSAKILSLRDLERLWHIIEGF